MVLKEGPPIKACPYWARFATAPNGWVIAYCSLDACKTEKEKGRVWEGPPKGRRCVFGYKRRSAKEEPAVFFYQPESGSGGVVRVDDRQMTDEAWDRLVELFSRDIAEEEGLLLTKGALADVTDEAINQARNT